MTDPLPDPVSTPDDEAYGELIAGYDWLAVACNVVQTLALMIIAVALVARL